MTAEIYVEGYTDIDFSPQTLMAEVSQNLRSIITTPKHSVPMFRDFGLNENIVDSPMNESAAKIKSEIIMACRKYEPRAKIKRVDFVPRHDGKLGVKVTFDIREALS